MSGQQGTDPAVESLASCLSARRWEILSAYERRLAEKGSQLVSHEETRHQVLTQAGEAFDEVLTSLRSGYPLKEDPKRLLSHDIGVSRASQGLHPIESLNAAAEFFTVFIDNVFACLGMDANSPLPLATLALQQSIM